MRSRKKNTRQRAGTTHGWGSMKKHRGKGNKGGAGMAGTGKRGDAKKPMIWKDKKYFGKHGFKKKGQKIPIRPVNLDHLQKLLPSYVEAKLATKEGETFIIELSSVGFNKLLGRGKVDLAMKITAKFASEKAVAKVKEKGGEVLTK